MKIAIVGAGISGLGAGVLLSREHDVHLFEGESRLGGHAHTVEVPEGHRSIPLDVGFLVFNELTYPHFTAFLRYLRVVVADSDMSLSIRSLERDLEWSGSSWNAIFGQRRNLVRPRFYAMLAEILRFHREADMNLALSRRHGWTLGELFTARRYSRELSESYVVPMGAAIWSTPEIGMLDYPAETFLSFFLNHKLLQVYDRPVWKTVAGGSINYVNRARERIGNIHSGSAVTSVRRHGDRLKLATAAGEADFDQVILAVPAPTALELLADATAQERAILGRFPTSSNSARLHGDKRHMPRLRRCWASWNVLAGSGEQVSLTYHLNRLQPLRTERDFYLTLNPGSEVKEEFGNFAFRHPLFTRDTIRAQAELPSIQGARGIHFAGAWTRYGFHEDGLLSAVQVAERLGVEVPWGRR